MWLLDFLRYRAEQVAIAGRSEALRCEKEMSQYKEVRSEVRMMCSFDSLLWSFLISHELPLLDLGLGRAKGVARQGQTARRSRRCGR
jgi:hypothetical protein